MHVRAHISVSTAPCSQEISGALSEGADSCPLKTWKENPPRSIIYALILAGWTVRKR